jgi:ATP-dependent DNA ligase
MSDTYIELLKPYTPKQLIWPAMHQQKIDGVPTIITKINNKLLARSRQGEALTSFPHILQFCDVLLQNNEAVVMELHIPNMVFKDISGIVRRRIADRRLTGWAFDFVPAGAHSQPYVARRRVLEGRLADIAKQAGCSPVDLSVKLIPGQIVNGPDEADQAHEALMLANPKAEGSVYHSLSKPFQPGTRKWTTQKRVGTPSIDLLIVGAEEAISQDGKPLGMVGRLKAEYSRYVSGKLRLDIIGVGPGKLNHSERKALWKAMQAGTYKPCIAQINYKQDDSYDALREARFICWREDKVEADIG